MCCSAVLSSWPSPWPASSRRWLVQLLWALLLQLPWLYHPWLVSLSWPHLCCPYGKNMEMSLCFWQRVELLLMYIRREQGPWCCFFSPLFSHLIDLFFSTLFSPTVWPSIWRRWCTVHTPCSWQSLDGFLDMWSGRCWCPFLPSLSYLISHAASTSPSRYVCVVGQGRKQVNEANSLYRRKKLKIMHCRGIHWTDFYWIYWIKKWEETLKCSAASETSAGVLLNCHIRTELLLNKLPLRTMRNWTA